MALGYEKVKSGRDEEEEEAAAASGRAPQGKATLDGWRAGRRVEEQGCEGQGLEERRYGTAVQTVQRWGVGVMVQGVKVVQCGTVQS